MVFRLQLGEQLGQVREIKQVSQHSEGEMSSILSLMAESVIPSSRWGLSPNAFQIRSTVDFDRPDFSAMLAQEQWVDDDLLDLIDSDRRGAAGSRLTDQSIQMLVKKLRAPLTNSLTTP